MPGNPYAFRHTYPGKFLVCHVLRSWTAAFRAKEEARDYDIRDDQTLPHLQEAIDQKDAH